MKDNEFIVMAIENTYGDTLSTREKARRCGIPNSTYCRIRNGTAGGTLNGTGKHSSTPDKQREDDILVGQQTGQQAGQRGTPNHTSTTDDKRDVPETVAHSSKERKKEKEKGSPHTPFLKEKEKKKETLFPELETESGEVKKRKRKPIRLTDQRTAWGQCLKYFAEVYHRTHGIDPKIGVESMPNFKRWIYNLGRDPEQIRRVIDWHFEQKADEYNDYHSIHIFIKRIDQFTVQAGKAGYVKKHVKKGDSLLIKQILEGTDA